MHGLLQNALLDHHFYSLPLFPITLNMTSVADPGEGPGGPAPPPLFLHQTDARRAEKNFGTPPLYLRVWMTGPPLSGGLDPPLDMKRKIG